MKSSALQPSSRGPRGVAALSLEDAILALRRRVGPWRSSRRALESCTGARFGLWVARTAAIPFIFASLYAARPLTEAIDAIVRMALSTFSLCAGFAALSAAGSAHARAVEERRGLFASRGIPMARVRAERPLGLLSWVVVHMLPLGLLVLAGCAITAEPWRAARLAGVSLGIAMYLVALGAGLALLSHACHLLGKTRGQSLFLGFVLLPELVSPAWPELPTLSSIYSGLLDACLALGGTF